MPSPSRASVMTPKERADYGFARVRDSAYEAVMELWRRRSAQGMTQAQLADALGGDAGWLSRNLKGPGNWTLRTIGRFVEALGGEVELSVYGLEDPLSSRPNYHAYARYEVNTPKQISGFEIRGAASIIGVETTAVQLYLGSLGVTSADKNVQVRLGNMK
jgi:transcriptional regulator with XRE-family HTH domain